jgi:cell division protein FtsW
LKYRFIPPKAKSKNKLVGLLKWDVLFHGPPPDWGLIYCVLGLLVFGWVMIYSSSALVAESKYHDQFFFLKKQIMWTLIGLAGFVVASNIPLSIWQSSSRYLFGGTVLCLILVLLVGREISGAKRWLQFAGFSFQPSELAKVASIFLVSDYLDRRQSRMKTFQKGLLPILVLMGTLLSLILIEPDLGTPMLIGGVFLFMLIVGGVKWKHLFVLGLMTLPVLLVALFKVRYRLERLMAFMDPWADAKGKGYQLIQSLIAMGSGGIFGRGIGESKVKMGSLPDCHTDFVFSILGEELGLIGTLTCVGLFLYLCLRGLRISKMAPTFFSKLAALGISLTIGFQALINMGVAVGLFPTKGMPLPFISFGGSSLLITLISMGFLASLSRQIKRSSVEKAR